MLFQNWLDLLRTILAGVLAYATIVLSKDVAPAESVVAEPLLVECLSVFRRLAACGD
jgi:hypothetical protein